jgi:hypothetical protein
MTEMRRFNAAPAAGGCCCCSPADASLAFELAEKVLRDKLGWLMQAGAGLKGTAVAALGHALVAVAAEGQPGQAAGGTAAGGSGLRAAREELLEPFPAHVLVRILFVQMAFATCER